MSMKSSIPSGPKSVSGPRPLSSTGTASTGQESMLVVSKKRRRLYILGALLLLFLIWATLTGWQQNQALESQEQELAQVKMTLAEAEEKRDQLQQQIERLHDPDYIAEVARRDYYLSKEGEVLFHVSD